MGCPLVEQPAPEEGHPTVNFPVFRLQKLMGLDGLVTDEVGMRLASLAYDVPPSRAIVELGAFKGKSACWMAEGARLGRHAHVWAIDPWDLPGNPKGKHNYSAEETYAHFHAQVDYMDLGEFITPIKAFSVDAAAKWDGPKIGLLFIDGSHTYADVKADYEAWSPHLVRGSVVVFDDYDTKPNPGVKQFVDEIKGKWDFNTPPLAIKS